MRSCELVKEWNADASHECIVHPHPPACMFGDISQFFVPAIQVKLDEFRSKGQLETKLMPLVSSGVAVQPNLCFMPSAFLFMFFV